MPGTWKWIIVLVCLTGVQAVARPNFVLIMADDLGYGDLGCYGALEVKTPHIDRLAREGLRFTDYHSNGPVCSPTRAALLTGRYPHRAGIPGVINAGFDKNRHHGLQPDEETFAEILRKSGYATGIVGKWHLGYETRYNPVHQGFDSFRGYVSGNVDYHAHLDRMGVPDWWHGDQLEPEEGYSTHLINRHAVSFIRSNADRPFCLYVAHEAPHDPFQGPDDPPIRLEGRAVPNRYAPGQVERAYREMIETMDRGVGEILETLEALHLSESTFVFFCSDNGATRVGSNGPLRGTKGTLWEGGHRVPAIARWPGTIPAGRTTDQTALSMDLFPTLLELAGTREPPSRALDGVSLAKLLKHGAPLPDRTIFWSYGAWRAVRDGRWKWVERTTADEAGATGDGGLFDLNLDPAETTDLAAKHPERVAALRRTWADWNRSMQETAMKQPERRSAGERN